jgi:Malectin domain
LVKFSEKMKTILIILTINTSVIAFEQIYAKNCGGTGHTDSDGIIYQRRSVVPPLSYIGWINFNIGSVPVSDRSIYYTVEYSRIGKNPLIYQLPLASDGLYVLIAKFSSDCDPDSCYINMKLNDIQLLSNVDQVGLCGGFLRSCDKYFYICVSNKKVYYENRSFLVKDDEIRVEFSANQGEVDVAGLVLLKGSLGERQKLNSSATNETLHFDQLNTNSECLADLDKKKLQKNTETVSDQCSNLNAVIQTSFENLCINNDNTQVTVLREIQNSQKEQCTEPNMAIKFDEFESKVKRIEEMVLEGNKIVKTDNLKLQADIDRIEETILKVQAEQTEIGNKLDLLLKLQVNTDSFIYFDSPEMRD